MAVGREPGHCAGSPWAVWRHARAREGLSALAGNAEPVVVATATTSNAAASLGREGTTARLEAQRFPPYCGVAARKSLSGPRVVVPMTGACSLAEPRCAQ
jgi:hypothetical protein